MVGTVHGSRKTGGTVTFFIQTFFIQDKVYTGQSLYGTKLIHNKIYTGTKLCPV